MLYHSKAYQRVLAQARRVPEVQDSTPGDDQLDPDCLDVAELSIASFKTAK